jgi:4-hydroxyphenylpyruvate dioxygenase-like putative hemolysin
MKSRIQVDIKGEYTGLVSPAMMTPDGRDSYDEILNDRLPNHGEPVDELHKRGILLDGSIGKGDPRFLLLFFSETQIGSIFFEFIQRKKMTALERVISRHCLNRLSGIRLLAVC